MRRGRSSPRLDLGERDQVALREDRHGDPSMIGASRPAQQHGLPAREPRGIGTADAERRHGPARRLRPAAGGSRRCLAAGRRFGGRPPAARLERDASLPPGTVRHRSRRNAATWPKQPSDAAHVAGERAHIGAFAAFGAEHRVVGVGDLDQARGDGCRPAAARAPPPRRRGRDRRRARRRS